jgi:hypothetical protein
MGGAGTVAGISSKVGAFHRPLEVSAGTAGESTRRSSSRQGGVSFARAVITAEINGPAAWTLWL